MLEQMSFGQSKKWSTQKIWLRVIFFTNVLDKVDSENQSETEKPTMKTQNR